MPLARCAAGSGKPFGLTIVSGWLADQPDHRQLQFLKDVNEARGAVGIDGQADLSRHGERRGPAQQSSPHMAMAIIELMKTKFKLI